MAERTPEQIQQAMDRMYRRQVTRALTAVVLALALVALYAWRTF